MDVVPPHPNLVSVFILDQRCILETLHFPIGVHAHRFLCLRRLGWLGWNSS